MNLICPSLNLNLLPKWLSGRPNHWARIASHYSIHVMELPRAISISHILLVSIYTFITYEQSLSHFLSPVLLFSLSISTGINLFVCPSVLLDFLKPIICSCVYSSGPLIQYLFVRNCLFIVFAFSPFAENQSLQFCLNFSKPYRYYDHHNYVDAHIFLTCLPCNYLQRYLFVVQSQSLVLQFCSNFFKILQNSSKSYVVIHFIQECLSRNYLVQLELLPFCQTTTRP